MPEPGLKHPGTSRPGFVTRPGPGPTKNGYRHLRFAAEPVPIFGGGAGGWMAHEGYMRFPVAIVRTAERRSPLVEPSLDGRGRY